jgi:D-arabinose 1-dehydrogenase-like Zn-dependent alcohol dehydrogenase
MRPLAQVAHLICAGKDTFGPLTRMKLTARARSGILGLDGKHNRTMAETPSVTGAAAGHLAL